MAKKKEQKVYMPLMIGDWLKGTSGMRAEVKGVYINLLLHQWDHGFIPSDMDELSLITPEIHKVWDKLKVKFPETQPGKLQNEKLEEVRAFWSKQKSNGELGGRPKGSTRSKYISQEKFDWEEMITFFDNSCVCCGHKFPEGERPTKDHVIPRISGGTDGINNLQPLCRQCNSSKHATHSTDYRLKFISKIPSDLRDKWFSVNPEVTQQKPKNNHHNDLDLDNDSSLKNKEPDFSKPDIAGDEIVFPIDSKPARDLWAGWKKSRWTNHNARYGMMGEQADLKRLQGMTFAQMEETILAAIAGEWRNLYPEKKQSGNVNGKPKFDAQATLDRLNSYGK